MDVFCFFLFNQHMGVTRIQLSKKNNNFTSFNINMDLLITFVGKQ